MLEPGSERDELVAVVALMRSRLLPGARLVPTIEHLGSAASVINDAIGGSESTATTRLEPGAIEAAVHGAEIEVEDWARRGRDVRTIFSPGYPNTLQSVSDKPPILFVEGTLDPSKDHRAVAVVL